MSDYSLLKSEAEGLHKLERKLETLRQVKLRRRKFVGSLNRYSNDSLYRHNYLSAGLAALVLLVIDWAVSIGTFGHVARMAGNLPAPILAAFYTLLEAFLAILHSGVYASGAAARERESRKWGFALLLLGGVKAAFFMNHIYTLSNGAIFSQSFNRTLPLFLYMVLIALAYFILWRGGGTGLLYVFQMAKFRVIAALLPEMKLLQRYQVEYQQFREKADEYDCDADGALRHWHIHNPSQVSQEHPIILAA